MRVRVIAATVEDKEFEGEKYQKRAAQCVGVVGGLQKVFTVGVPKGKDLPAPGDYSLVTDYYVNNGKLTPFIAGFDPVPAK